MGAIAKLHTGGKAVSTRAWQRLGSSKPWRIGPGALFELDTTTCTQIFRVFWFPTQLGTELSLRKITCAAEVALYDRGERAGVSYIILVLKGKVSCPRKVAGSRGGPVRGPPSTGERKAGVPSADAPVSPRCVPLSLAARCHNPLLASVCCCAWRRGPARAAQAGRRHPSIPCWIRRATSASAPGTPPSRGAAPGCSGPA
jgi:hypothetical protein